MSIYDQFIALRKNQFKHTMYNQIMGKNAKRPKAPKGTNPDMQDAQSAQQRDLRKMASQEFGKNMTELTNAYSPYADGQTQNQGPTGGAAPKMGPKGKV